MRAILPLLSIGFFLVATSGSAQLTALQVQSLQHQFSSYTYSQLTDYNYDPANPDPAHFTVVSNRLSSPFSISDSIISPTWNHSLNNYSGPARLEAKSGASLSRLETFAQSAAGDRPLGYSIATALSQITFSPLATGISSFNFDLRGWRQYYGAQLVRLTDLTLGQELWSYGYSGLGENSNERFERLLPPGVTFQNEINWEFTGAGNECGFSLNLDTFLSDTSTYQLTLFATVESQAPETEHVLIDWLNAPTVVPEPSVLAIFGFGSLGLLWRRRKTSAKH